MLSFRLFVIKHCCERFNELKSIFRYRLIDYVGRGLDLVGNTCICLQKYISFLFQLMIEGQDDQINMIGTSVGVLKNMSQQIGNELDEQAV